MIEESPALPEVINDRYRVLKLLGQGGMGQVFLVDDLHRKGQRMALKTLLPKTTDRLLTSGFRDEFAELAKLEHPHLARAYDFGRISKSSEYFFTTEFIQGVDLMKGVRDATVNELVNISSQILRGLDFIHRNGILHNDLKPANILLASEAHGPVEGGPDGAARPRGDGLNRLESLVTDHRGQVKIIDFGLISREHTAWDKILGTLRYISPERILCKKADRRSDLYSIGIVFYVLFTHRVPFAASDPKLILRQHLEQAPNPVQKYRPDLPEFVPRFIHKLLEKKPEDRFPSGEEVLGFIGQAMGWETPAEVIPSASWKGGRLTAGTLLHRNPEIDALRERFDAAREGTRDSHAMIVEGPSGVGKTRLVEELRGYVQVSEGVFVAVSGSDVGGDLQPVAEALLSGLQTRGVSGLQEARSRLEFAKAREGNLLQALEKLLLWFTKNSPLLLHFDDFDRASKTVRRFVLELLCAADARSREGDKPCRLFIVVSRRSASGTGDLGISNVPSIELVNFSDQESRTFVRSVFGQDDIPEPVLATLARSSEGNPLFLLELANKLVDGKQARFSGARWQFPSSLEGIELPDTLDHLFEEKLESLTKQALDVLSWVAVAGRPLAENVLRRCASSGEKLLGGHLEQLCSKNLLEAKTLEDGSQEVQLTYWGIRDRLVEQLGEERLKLFHQRLAQNIEEEFPDWEDRADALAQHWKEAGNEAGFLRFAPQAAELLRTRGDLETAVSYRRRIVDAMPETALAKKIQSLAKLSEMHEVLWDLESCHQDLLEIQTLGGKLMKPAEQALLLRRIASVEMAMFRYERADQRLEEASRVLSQAPPLHRLSIDAPRAITLRFTGKHDEARELLARTVSSLAEPPANEPKQKM
ncbi:MAG: protein kinase, partial [Planctomycetota bacterium]|nr:protein kinase [Planctomycetota bacterium]